MSQSYSPPPPGPNGPGAAAPQPMGASRAGRTPGPTLINGATTHGLLGEQRMRHPWEIPLLVVGSLITTGAYLLWLAIVIMSVVNAIRGNGPTLLDLGEGPLATFLYQLFAVIMLLPLIL